MKLLKTGIKPYTEFKKHLPNIKVTLLNYPTLDALKSYIPEFTLATWEDTPGTYTEEERNKAIEDLFNNYLLPTAYETIRLTFRVEGLDSIDVTHLIRHRTLSFSAQCTADRDMRLDDCLVKEGIRQSKFYERYQRLVEDAKELYADMVDSNQISILDARTVLPKSLSNFYYVSGNIKDILAFIRTRLDEQIQPESDNVVALRMYEAICEVYPFLKGSIQIGGVDKWYCDTLPTGRSSNIYYPKPENKIYLDAKGIDYTSRNIEYVYSKTRNSLLGSEVYNEIKREVIDATR